MDAPTLILRPSLEPVMGGAVVGCRVISVPRLSLDSRVELGNERGARGLEAVAVVARYSRLE